MSVTLNLEARHRETAMEFIPLTIGMTVNIWLEGKLIDTVLVVDHSDEGRFIKTQSLRLTDFIAHFMYAATNVVITDAETGSPVYIEGPGWHFISKGFDGVWQTSKKGPAFELTPLREHLLS